MRRRREMRPCKRCERMFVVCGYNAHHQQYCTTAECVAERKRERQRKHYQAKYRSNAVFRASERERALARVRRRREAARCAGGAGVDLPGAGGAVSVLPDLNVELFAAGLLSQLLDSTDPEEVSHMAREYERRGRDLAVMGRPTRRSPRPRSRRQFSSTLV